MALVQIDYPANLTDQADFSAHGDLIEAGLWDKVNSPLLVVSGNIPQGAVLQIGSDIYHGTSDTAISGTASDYVEVTPDGAGAATAKYITLAEMSVVAWNAQYNGYYNAGATKLYIFDEGKALAAGAIAAVFGRYLAQQATGDVAIGRDLAVKRNATVGGTLGVTGAATVGSITSAPITGNATVGGTLGVTGASTLASANVTGNATVGGILNIPSVAASSIIAGTTDGNDNVRLRCWDKFTIYNPTTSGLNPSDGDWNIQLGARDGGAVFRGNVGIGKTPTTKLDVNGNVAATTAAISGNTTVGGTLGVTGAISANSNRVTEMYGGSARDETNYPIGTIIAVDTGSDDIPRNAAYTIQIRTDTARQQAQFVLTGGTNINGVWRCRGITTVGRSLFQRVS